MSYLPDTATRTTVAADAVVDDIPANESRRALHMKNNTTATFYLTYATSGTPSAADNDIAIASGDIWREDLTVGDHVYTGAYRVISSSSTSGNLCITEFT